MAQQPLLDHHFVLLAATLSVPAGAGLGAAVTRISEPARYAVAGLAVIAIAVGFAQEERRLWRQDGDPPGVTWAADQLRNRTGPDDLVGTDLPIVAYLADRRLPGQLVDTSFVRLGTGSLTDAKILEELEGVRAVVVGRELANRPALIRELDGALSGAGGKRRRHALSRSLTFSSRIASRWASVTFWSTTFEIAVE